MKKLYKLPFLLLTILTALTVILIFESFQNKPVEESNKTTKTDTLYSNINGQGMEIVIDFVAGIEHNHPTMAFWIEDLEGNFIQTLYVTASLATGIYNHGAAGKGQWKQEKGEARRPATLPYYLHKRGKKAMDGTYLPTPSEPIPDAYTGATPKHNFMLHTKTNDKQTAKFRILMEINQPWDWNEYWHNAKYPNDEDYKTSCQPALVYAVTVDPSNTDTQKYYLNPIGHSHYAGKDGNLYTNLTTLSTALNIIEKVAISIQ